MYIQESKQTTWTKRKPSWEPQKQETQYFLRARHPTGAWLSSSFNGFGDWGNLHQSRIGEPLQRHQWAKASIGAVDGENHLVCYHGLKTVNANIRVSYRGWGVCMCVLLWMGPFLTIFDILYTIAYLDNDLINWALLCKNTLSGSANRSQLTAKWGSNFGSGIGQRYMAAKWDFWDYLRPHMPRYGKVWKSHIHILVSPVTSIMNLHPALCQ